MKKRMLCLLCAMVMALLPLTVMAEKSNGIFVTPKEKASEELAWIPFTGMNSKGVVTSASLEEWSEDVGCLVYVGIVANLAQLRQETERLSIQAEGVYVGGNKDEYIYYVFGYGENRVAVVKLDTKNGEDNQYMLMDVESWDETERICQEYCGDDCWKLDSEQVALYFQAMFAK